MSKAVFSQKTSGAIARRAERQGAALGAALLLTMLGFGCGGSSSVLFEADCSGRPHRTEIGVSGCVDGGYHIFLKTPLATSSESITQFLPPATSIRIEVSARELQNPGSITADEPIGSLSGLGVFCFGRADQSEYEFIITPETAGYEIARTHRPARPRLFAHGKSSSAIHKGPSSNLLEADCLGTPSGKTTLVFRVNGKQLAKATDPDGIKRFDEFGLIVESGDQSEDVIFDDLLVRKP